MTRSMLAPNNDDIDDDIHAFQVTRVAAVLATKITSSLEMNAFTLTAWEVWEILRELSWEILRELSLSKERSFTSENVENEKISASEESMIEFLDTRTILRVLEVLNASR